MGISEEDIAKAAREAAARVVKPTPCACGLDTWDAASYFRTLIEALHHDSERDFISILPGLQRRLDRMKDYCGITADTAQLHLRAAELSVRAGKFLDALFSTHKAFFEVDDQLTIGVTREIKEAK
jgi:hypothetical protein